MRRATWIVTAMAPAVFFVACSAGADLYFTYEGALHRATPSGAVETLFDEQARIEAFALDPTHVYVAMRPADGRGVNFYRFPK